MAKYRLVVEVEIDPTEIQIWSGDGEGNDGGIYCTTTGDTYETMNEFFEHQLERDLQVARFQKLSGIQVLENNDED